MLLERLEPRFAMDGDCVDNVDVCVSPASDSQNALIAEDVNQDGVVTPIDALIVINELNKNGPRPVEAVSHTVDVNGDGYVTPLDSLVVINELNRSATPFDEISRVISVDLTIGPARPRRIDIPFGSVTVERVRLTENELTFRYTPEIEGGYTIYECTVALSQQPILIEIGSDGMPGATSFDLATCEVIRRGNIFEDWDA
jgi:hypothetical protein